MGMQEELLQVQSRLPALPLCRRPCDVSEARQRGTRGPSSPTRVFRWLGLRHAGISRLANGPHSPSVISLPTD